MVSLMMIQCLESSPQSSYMVRIDMRTYEDQYQYIPYPSDVPSRGNKMRIFRSALLPRLYPTVDD